MSIYMAHYTKIHLWCIVNNRLTTNKQFRAQITSSRLRNDRDCVGWTVER